MFGMRNSANRAQEHSSPARLAADTRCRLGEQPLWDVIHQQIVWTDIDGGRLYRFDCRTSEWTAFYAGPPVGGLTLQSNGSLLLFRATDICCIFRDGTITPVVTGIDNGILRFNDAIADPEGRVFVGSKSPAGTRSAGVFRLNTNGRLDRIVSGTATANGMGFSPDLRTFYWTDMTERTIFALDYDRRTGALSDGRALIVIEPGEGVPDGLTVDHEGCLWSARWDGSAVHRYSPAGEWLSKIDLPVAKVSAPTFGGPDLHTLFVTTARAASQGPSIDGGLFSTRMAVQGRLEFFSRVLL